MNNLEHQSRYDLGQVFTVNRFASSCLSTTPVTSTFSNSMVKLSQDRYAPFPSLFIIHEMRVRGFHPFQPVAPTVPDDILWQDWILSGQVFDNASNSFKRDSLPPNDNDRSAEAQLPFHPMTTASSSQRTLALNADVIADILAATRAAPLWKACQVEGTAEENIQKCFYCTRSLTSSL